MAPLLFFLLINAVALCVFADEPISELPGSISPIIAIPKPRTIYVLGDLHGDLNNTIAILKSSGIVSQDYDGKDVESSSSSKEGRKAEWIGGDKIVVQLGNIANKGDDAPAIYRLFKALKGQAEKKGGEVHHLFGIHEGLVMCKHDSDVSLAEMKKYFNSTHAKWVEAWAPKGEIGEYVRRNFEIVKVLFGRLLFVHAGLMPAFSKFTPAELKSAYLDRIDKQYCQSPIQEKGPAPSNYTELKSSPNFHYDMIYGRFSPTLSREQSLRPEQTACAFVKESLALAELWPVVQEQQGSLVVDGLMIAMHNQSRYHSLTKSSEDTEVPKHATVPIDSCSSPIKDCPSVVAGGPNLLKTMMVGHTPVGLVGDRKGRDLILRCQNQTSTTRRMKKKGSNRSGSNRADNQNDERNSSNGVDEVDNNNAKSNSTAVSYIMADAGISRHVMNNIKFVEIQASFVPQCYMPSCPLDVNLEFYQISLDYEEGSYREQRKFLMSIIES